MSQSAAPHFLGAHLLSPAIANLAQPPWPIQQTTTSQSPTTVTNWLDAPYQEWRVETAADRAHLAATSAPREEAASRIRSRRTTALPPLGPVRRWGKT